MSDEQALPEMCVVAFKTCGCLAAVALEHARSAADVVAYAQQPGYRVEHLTKSEYQAALKRCSEHPRPAVDEVRKAGGAMLPLFEDVPERRADTRYPG